MQALISPDENVYSLSGELLGVRVAQVSENAFPIAPPLFWTPCAADTVAVDVYYDTADNIIKPIPVDEAAAILEAEMAALNEAQTMISV